MYHPAMDRQSSPHRTGLRPLVLALGLLTVVAAPVLAADLRAQLVDSARQSMVHHAGMDPTQSNTVAQRIYNRGLPADNLKTVVNQGVALARQDKILAQYYWSLLYYFSQTPSYTNKDLAQFIKWSTTQDFVSAVTRGREGNFVVSPRHHQIWAEMQRFWGAPYHYGGDSPSGTDCSGFTMRSFARAGISLPRTSREQFKRGIPLRVEDLAPGDMVFFDTSRRNGISHVGIYLGENKFAHSASSKGVAYSFLQGDKYWWPAYRGARRLF